MPMAASTARSRSHLFLKSFISLYLFHLTRKARGVA
jgi:hypothetical protein